MSIVTTTHLNFRGQAREALEHYASVFGGDATVVTFGQAGVSEEGARADEVIWGGVTTPQGFRIMAFDVPPERAYDPGTEALFVAVQGDDEGEIRSYFEALADGGSVRTPLGPSPWAPAYGMVTDRFGITWVISSSPAEASAGA